MNVLILDVEGITLKNESTNAVVTRAGFAIVRATCPQLSDATILSHEDYWINYNLHEINHDSYIGQFQFCKKNFPLTFKDGRKKLMGYSSLNYVRSVVRHRYDFYNCVHIYTKGLSTIDRFFLSGYFDNLPISCLTTVTDIPKYIGDHEPIEEIKYFVSILNKSLLK